MPRLPADRRARVFKRARCDRSSMPGRHQMNTIQLTLLSFACSALLSGCTMLRPHGPPVTLEKAVEESVVALKSAEEKARTHGHSWGLLPAEVTLIYNISKPKLARSSWKHQSSQSLWVEASPLPKRPPAATRLS